MHGDMLVIPMWFVVGMHCSLFQGHIVGVKFVPSKDLLLGHVVLVVLFHFLL